MIDVEVTDELRDKKTADDILIEVKQEVMAAFEQRLDRVLGTWDGRGIYDITLKFSIVPSIHYDIGELRTQISTDKLRFFVDLLRTSPIMGVTQLVKWVLAKRKKYEEEGK